MNDLIPIYLRLRIAVGVLGQRNQRNWWDCTFLTDAGQESLDYNFPRAPLAAGFTATCLAAKRLHDERIGRTGVYHLFRLPPEAEIPLQNAAIKDSGAALLGIARDPAACLAELVSLGKDEIDCPEGPVQIGLLEKAISLTGIAELARHYHAAFRNQLRIYPYFASRS